MRSKQVTGPHFVERLMDQIKQRRGTQPAPMKSEGAPCRRMGHSVNFMYDAVFSVLEKR